jgi:hypothetical protein
MSSEVWTICSAYALLFAVADVQLLHASPISIKSAADNLNRTGPHTWAVLRTAEWIQNHFLTAQQSLTPRGSPVRLSVRRLVAALIGFLVSRTEQSADVVTTSYTRLSIVSVNATYPAPVVRTNSVVVLIASQFGEIPPIRLAGRLGMASPKTRGTNATGVTALAMMWRTSHALDATGTTTL